MLPSWKHTIAYRTYIFVIKVEKVTIERNSRQLYDKTKMLKGKCSKSEHLVKQKKGKQTTEIQKH